MFIIELTYKVPATEIDAAMAAHVAFLEKYYHSGHFLASGRKEPRDGGLIFARATSKAEIEKIISEDPFNINGLANYRIIEFKATKKIKAFDDFAGDEI
ncbi:YciI family protein [Flavihumibacter sp.]|uniref:YciI family protein n=1 Tax=Flavihumibacter sp. TaxID=1913981 RepID=UPI002FCA5210|nr:YciI family protein [Flavihumibacter sediminis]